MDNNSFASVREAARTILTATNNKVNILICNAGVMGIPDLRLTADGHEVHFQTNYLSHFLLFQLLSPALLSSATQDFHSRVVVVSSSAHRAAILPASNNYRYEHIEYTHEQAYAISKLAEIYLANAIERKYGGRKLHATSLHPGAVATNISRNLDPAALEQIVSNPYVLKILKSAEQGAATTVVAAVGKEWEGRGGRYLQDCEEAKRGEDDGEAFGIGWVKQTYDLEEEERLYRDSVKMIGMGDEG